MSDEPTYYFCETVTAGPVADWHIRKGTEAGPFFGGGADTPALCGRVVAWDLDVEINERQLDAGTCSKCRKLYEQRDDNE